MNRLADSIVGGWVATGFTHWSSGAPISISSNRSTNGSASRGDPVLQNLTVKQLQNNIGVYKTGGGVYYINPALGLVKPNGAANLCTAGQTTPCFGEPAPGGYGNLPYNGFSGPHFFDQDFSLSKDTNFSSA